MQIISHRGYWNTAAEKNTASAFQRSFQLGFGTETDIRDCKGELVISHDMPVDQHISVATFFEMVNSYHNKDLPLALNIKADGLQTNLASLLHQYQITNYFLFDMSVPDLKQAIEKGLNVFSRLSELEMDLPFYEQVKGLWIDAFYETWYHAEQFDRYIADEKQLCFVSAELHRRDHITHWKSLKEMGIHLLNNTLLCTDFPELAQSFFYGKE